MPRLLASARRALTLATVVFAAACANNDSTSPPTGTPSDPATETYATSLGVNITSMTKVSPDLYFEDVVVGTGDVASNGRILRVTYTGWLANGARFDTNVGGDPLVFTLGASGLIAGWNQGIVGMRLGGKRKIVIGSNLGYGPGGRGPIPGNATLVFEVQLVGIT